MTTKSFSFDRFDNRVTLQGTLTTETALRIGAGKASDLTGADLPVVRDMFARPYIPGSSFKGALRSFVESLVRGLNDSKRAACNPVNENDWCLTAKEREKAKTDEEIARKLCLVCQLFGSPWWAAKVNIRDLLVEDGLWFGQFEHRNGVAIDRETETAADQKLYDFEVVPAGTIFNCEIVVENAEDWQLGLLMLGLRTYERGESAIGGARSRGLGLVRLTLPSRKQICGGDGLLNYLAGDGDGSEISQDQIKGWVSQFRAKLSALSQTQEEQNHA